MYGRKHLRWMKKYWENTHNNARKREMCNSKKLVTRKHHHHFPCVRGIFRSLFFHFSTFILLFIYCSVLPVLAGVILSILLSSSCSPPFFARARVPLFEAPALKNSIICSQFTPPYLQRVLLQVALNPPFSLWWASLS